MATILDNIPSFMDGGVQDVATVGGVSEGYVPVDTVVSDGAVWIFNNI